MTYRSHSIAPSRVFDHLYDPVFTTSDQRNVTKENCIALMRSAPIQVYPIYDAMFSEMSYDERNFYVYQKNILPFPNPIISSNIERRERFDISGTDRPKFFKNPLKNVSYKIEEKYLEVEKNEKDAKEIVECKKSNSVAVQTLYRYEFRFQGRATSNLSK